MSAHSSSKYHFQTTTKQFMHPLFYGMAWRFCFVLAAKTVQKQIQHVNMCQVREYHFQLVCDLSYLARVP